jgi:hypothetical protein
MKIRWTKSSVRFRITPSEFAALQSRQSISETLFLPGGGAWQVVIGPGQSSTALTFEDGALHLNLGEDDRQRLAEPEREGVYFQMEAAPNCAEMRYFLEKDFPCAHPRASDALEPHSETFTPPLGFEERKNAPLGRAASPQVRLHAPAST